MLERTKSFVDNCKGIDEIPLPFPFVCKDCGRENTAVWVKMEDGGAVLVCKCGGDKITSLDV